MALKKITEADLSGRGVVGMDDVPGLSAGDMQYKVEEIVRRVVIPTINENVDSTATKAELEQAVFDSGAADMTKAVYDADDNGIVDRADNGFMTYIHTKSGSVHNLAGSGDIFRFVAAADWAEGDSMTVNGRQARVYKNTGERAEGEKLFGAGAIVCGAIDTSGDRVKIYPFKTGVSGGVDTDGNTLTPVDDVTLWQQCAGLDTGYSINEILADTAVLARLLGDFNAMNYLIRSKDIQAAVLADAGAVAILDRLAYQSISCGEDESMAYGTVTHSEGNYSYHTNQAFRNIGTDLATKYTAYFGPGWVRWDFGDAIGEKWIYRVQFANTTSMGGIMFVGVKRDGTEVNLLAAENTTGGTIVQAMAIPNDGKYVAVKVMASANAYLTQCRFWAR